MRAVSVGFLVVDLGFVAYWGITGLHLLPPAWLYPDAHDADLVTWNWSFLPLDLLVSATGLSALSLRARGDRRWPVLAAVSLAWMFASGLQAVAFWAIRGDFDPVWWAANLALMAFPLAAAPAVARAIGDPRLDGPAP